jgi:hypothetical protein
MDSTRVDEAIERLQVKRRRTVATEAEARVTAAVSFIMQWERDIPTDAELTEAEVAEFLADDDKRSKVKSLAEKFSVDDVGTDPFHPYPWAFSVPSIEALRILNTPD